MKIVLTNRYRIAFFLIFVKKIGMPRVKLFDQDEALKKAMELFWQKGYASTSLSDLTEHLGIGKGSFYATFKSKQELFEAAFDLYSNSRIGVLENLLNAESDVKSGLKKLLELNLEEFLNDDLHKGCFVSNSCSDFSGNNESLHTRLLTHHQVIEQVLVDYFVRHGVSTTKAESVTSTVITFLMGMSQQTKFNRDKDGYLKSIDHLVELLG